VPFHFPLILIDGKKSTHTHTRTHKVESALADGTILEVRDALSNLSATSCDEQPQLQSLPSSYSHPTTHVVVVV